MPLLNEQMFYSCIGICYNGIFLIQFYIFEADKRTSYIIFKLHKLKLLDVIKQSTRIQ